MDVLGKLEVLARSARYDVSCASSGATRTAVRLPGACGWPGQRAEPALSSMGPPGGRFGSASSMGICHSFGDDGRCISLLKVLLTNACINDCAYCVNRRSSNAPRAGFRVDELVSLTEAFYRRNYIEGLFLSSGVLGSPDITMEMLIRVARALRLGSGFAGYIHGFMRFMKGTIDESHARPRGVRHAEPHWGCHEEGALVEQPARGYADSPSGVIRLVHLGRIEYILVVPTTTIHFPEETLRRVDAVARQRKISRNRFVIQACEKAVASDAGEWPEGFFEQQISTADQALLNQAVKEMETAIARSRTSGGAPLL